MSKATEPTLKEIALRIRAHLMRIEDSGKNGIASFSGAHAAMLWHANAWRAGRYVAIKYVSYQMTVNLTKVKASAYLAWLDAGNEGTHYKMERAA